MKLLSQVCTKDQAIKLRTLGIRQESLFRHDNEGNIFSNGMDASLITFQSSVAAFTVAELGIMLPTHFELNQQFGCLCIWKKTQREDKWLCEYQNDKVSCISNYTASEETEAAAKCDLLIHLLETGKVTSEECNSRLISA